MRRAKATLVVLMFLGVYALPARAQFYNLEGRFQCLNNPAAICFDAASDWPPPSPPEARVIPDPAPAVVPAKAIPMPASVTPPGPAADPIRDIAARLEAKKPAPDDVSMLRRAAGGGDRRALELLAWSALMGLGTERDPVQAYLLYSAAASVGITNARQNRASIYENELTPEQRHQALLIENDVLLPPPQ
jgi:hypothetical protein